MSTPVQLHSRQLHHCQQLPLGQAVLCGTLSHASILLHQQAMQFCVSVRACATRHNVGCSKFCNLSAIPALIVLLACLLQLSHNAFQLSPGVYPPFCSQLPHLKEATLSSTASVCHCRHVAEHDRPHLDWLLNTKWLQCTARWSSDHGSGRHHIPSGTVPHQQSVSGQERPHILPVRGGLHWLWNHFLYLV